MITPITIMGESPQEYMINILPHYYFPNGLVQVLSNTFDPACICQNSQRQFRAEKKNIFSNCFYPTLAVFGGKKAQLFSQLHC